ncbi:MAG: amidohydrolase family protein [Trueperaceae bacterium]
MQPVIDYHTHIGTAEQWGEPILAEAERMRGAGAATLATSFSAHGAAMANVSRAIVLAFRSLHLGVDVPNEYVAEYVATDPQKFIGFASVDPHDGNALPQLRRAHRELGLRGLKTSPIYQAYEPLDARMLGIYRYCEDHGLPILTHHGTTFPRTAPLKWAHPQQIEEIALAYPELRILIAHLGHPWEAETIAVVRKHPHVYADISALFYRPWQLYGSLTLAKEYGVWNKLVFGTDFPVTTADETVDGLERLLGYARHMPFPSFSREDIEALIGNDILGELGLH